MAKTKPKTKPKSRSSTRVNSKSRKKIVSASTLNIKKTRIKVLAMVIVPVVLVLAFGFALYKSNTQKDDIDAQTVYAAPLWQADFENGNYTYGSSVLSGAGNVSVVNEGHNGGKAVKIVHPPNQYYGAAWYPRLSSNLGISNLEDAYLRYYLKPDPNYHFRLEAKIPGLAGNSGNNYFPSGCDPTDSNQGWSGRLQWGLGPQYNHQKGRIQTYLYVGHPASNTGGCGFKAEWESGAELERGKWACIEVRYKMNTPGQNNGNITGWFNDVKKYERNDIRYRNNSSIKSTILANVFYHGGTAAWQPIQTQHVLYDKVAISNQRIGCGTSTTTTPSTPTSPTPTTPTTPTSPTPSTGSGSGITAPNNWSAWIPGAKSDGGTPVTRSQNGQLYIAFTDGVRGYKPLQWANYCLNIPTSVAVPKSITYSATYNPNGFTRVYAYIGESSNKLMNITSTSGVATTKSFTFDLDGKRKVCFGNETLSNISSNIPNRYLKINSYNFSY